MNCWNGASRAEFKVRMRTQLEYAEKGIPFEKIIKKIKDAHPSWLKNIKKYAAIGVSLAQDNLVPDQVPSLEECYAMLGKAMVRKAFLERVSMDISNCYGKSYIRIKCREIDTLQVRTTEQVSLIQEMIWALLDKEWKEKHPVEV